jgi:CubicO group peptidase (beta-lactamase class C family)
MQLMTRRTFTLSMAGLGVQSLNKAFREACEAHKIPGASVMVADADRIIFAATQGNWKLDTLARIYSMTKPITTTAVMQFVDRGKLTLDSYVGDFLPEVDKIPVLDGFELGPGGDPKLRPAKTRITVRQLLAHTSGFGYEFTSAELMRYSRQTGKGGLESRAKGILDSPRLFEAGARWQYGVGLDWAGKLVEKLSGLTLGQYLQQNVCGPLGMTDTGFYVPADKRARLIGSYARQEDGSLKESPAPSGAAPAFESGGGGLYGTLADYVRFMQMILQHGKLGKTRVLGENSVAEMSRNQIGNLAAGRITTAMPSLSNDVNFHPGGEDRWGLGFLLNTTAYDSGRPAGCLGWAGAANTFFWIDPHKKLCVVLLMQILPFFDREAVGLLRDFEHAIYGG